MNQIEKLADSIRTWLPARLSKVGGCTELITKFQELSTDVDTIPELVSELSKLELEIRNKVTSIKEKDPRLAKALSKLADIPACADIMSEEEILNKLDFFNSHPNKPELKRKIK